MTEARCDHGFVRSRIPCPTCDRGPRAAVARVEQSKAVTDADIESALRTGRSVQRASKTLGISRVALLARAEKSPQILDALNELRSTMGARAFRHPGFIDQTGKKLAGVEVLTRAENIDGNAYWLCRFACGHERPVKGTELRDRDRQGGHVICHECPVRKVPRRKKATAAE